MVRGISLALLLGLLAHTVVAQDLLRQRVSLSAEDALLEQALYRLMDDYGIPLSFSNDVLPQVRVTAHFDNRPLDVVLTGLLAGTPVAFRQLGRQIVLFRSDYSPPSPRRYTISGFISDADSGERLIAATVFDLYSGQGTQTNEYGFFSLSLPPGRVRLQCSYLGYTPEIRSFELGTDTRLPIQLRTSLMLEEVLVVAGDSINRSQGGYSAHSISPLHMERLPALGGEPDVLRTTHFLAGVQTGTDGIGGISVRGSDAGHNLVLLDGVPVYNVSHGAGLFSIFNTYALQKVTFIKGAFPARYGGRLASVLDVRTREGHNREFHGRAGVGLLSARAMLEGPIVPGKSSFLFGGRWSFLNWYLMPISREMKNRRGENGSTAYRFYDINLKLNWTLTPNDRLYLSLYSGEDRFLNFGQARESLSLISQYGEDTTRVQHNWSYCEQFGWGNQVTALRWNHLFGPRLFSNTTLTYSNLSVEVQSRKRDSLLQDSPSQLLGRTLNQGFYSSGIQDFGARMDFEFIPSARHHVRFGPALTYYRVLPGVLQFDEKTEELVVGTPLAGIPLPSTEAALYLEDDIRPNERTLLNVGLRTTWLGVKGRSYLRLEPRLSFSWTVHPNWTLYGSAGLQSQGMHQLSSTNLGLPVDLWVPSTREVAPQSSVQGSVGVTRRLGAGFECTVEGYAKWMNHLATYQEGAYFLDDWQQNITTGKGRSFGLETTLQRQTGRTTGSIAYSLAWTDRHFPLINQGQEYPFRYDRRHDLKVVLSHSLTNWLDITADWLFGTGLAFSFPLYAYDIPFGNLPIGEQSVLVYDGKNNYRLPPYHRLDIGIHTTFRSARLEHNLSLGVFNTYDRRNPLYYDLRTRIESDGRRLIRLVDLDQVNVVPLLPYLNYSVKF